MPKASWHTYEPVDTSEALKGAEIAFGAKLVAKYNFAAIDRILALDSDFLGCDTDRVANCRAFGQRRKNGSSTVKDESSLRRGIDVHGDGLNGGSPFEASFKPNWWIPGRTRTRAKNQSHRQTQKGQCDTGQFAGSRHCLPRKVDQSNFQRSGGESGKIHRHCWLQPASLGSCSGPCRERGTRGLSNEDKSGKILKPDLIEFRPPPPEVLEKGITELTADMAVGKVSASPCDWRQPSLQCSSRPRIQKKNCKRSAPKSDSGCSSIKRPSSAIGICLYPTHSRAGAMPRLATAHSVVCNRSSLH